MASCAAFGRSGLLYPAGRGLREARCFKTDAGGGCRSVQRRPAHLFFYLQALTLVGRKVADNNSRLE